MRKAVRTPSGIYRVLRTGFLILLSLVVLVVLWKWKGENAYLRWTKNQQLDRAEQLFRSGHMDEAARTTRRIIETVDPTNLRAARLMAQLAERLQVRDALLWRERVVELEPWNSTNLVDWAQSALNFNDYLTAFRALSRYPTNPPPPAYFHDTAAVVAVGVGDNQQAEYHFAEAVRLDPTNHARQFNLAKVRLFAEAPPRQEEARKSLQKLAANPETRTEALSLLTEDALSHRQWNEAVRQASQLVTQTNLSFSKRLLYLRALHASRSPSYTNTLQTMQAEAIKTPDDLVQLLIWLKESGQTPFAMNWVRSLPPELRQPQQVGVGIADLYIGLGDWLGLRNWVRSVDWPGLNFLRFAYDAYAAVHLGGKDRSTAEVDGLWGKAIVTTENNPQQLEMLAKIGSRWGLAKQTENTLWALVNTGKGAEDALLALQRNYLIQDDTLGQYRVARSFHTLKPSDPASLNNLVYLGLLLGVDDSNLQKLADQLHQLSPKNPLHVSTYAFALMRRGEAQAAVDLMNTLEPSDLRRPSLAAMMGVFLAKTGDTIHAREYLKLAGDNKLLPEETKLVNEARASARLR